jgi:hypothetical protein
VSKLKKRHPALKHGAYSSIAVLPGENPVEFEELYQALVAELAPTGALEEDIVANIARLVWRKQNLATFNLAKGLRKAWHKLTSEIIQEKFRGTTREARRITASDSERAELVEALGAAKDQMREEFGEGAFQLIEIDDTATVERLLSDLEIEERLEAMIDKCLKRLLFVRGLKSLQPVSSSVRPQPVSATIPKKVA